jgi:membrane-associated phospholipid phosphatase
VHAAIFDTVVATLDARAAYPRPAPAITDHTVVPLGAVDASESSFPSEHAAVAAAAAAVLTHLFPEESAEELAMLAEEAANSRLWAGMSYRSDVEAGRAIGTAVGERAVARVKIDEAVAPEEGPDRPTGDGYWQPTPPAYIQQPLDPLAGRWATWVVGDVAQYRPAPPPTYRSAAWEAELGAVRDAVARRTPDQEEAVRFWAGGPGTVTPAGQWTEIACDLMARQGLDLAPAARILALTSVAIADAFLCCWDAKYTYWTARPITADPELDVLIPTPPFPSYPSGHATISTAAATVLGHLFPDQEAALAARAEEARNTRLWAGIHFPIDNDIGAVLGGLIGRLVILRDRDDSSV